MLSDELNSLKFVLLKQNKVDRRYIDTKGKTLLYQNKYVKANLISRRFFQELQLCKKAIHFYNLRYTLSILTRLHNRIYPQSKFAFLLPPFL